jgi:hypothetical protein
MRSEGETAKIGESTVDFFHNNAPAHRSVLVKDFLTNNNVTTLEHSPYVSDLASPDFQQFPRLKSSLNRRRSFATTDVIKNATEELKILSRDGFKECLQHIYSRWQKCIISQGEYFEGNVA